MNLTTVATSPLVCPSSSRCLARCEATAQYLVDEVDLVLNVVNPLVQLRDVHLPVLEPGLAGLVLALQVVDLLHQLLLSLQRLLPRLLQLLHVLPDGLQLLFDRLEVLLGKLRSLHSSLQLCLLHTKLPAQLMFSPTVSSSSSIDLRFFSASS